jgi:hypothetical protein
MPMLRLKRRLVPASWNLQVATAYATALVMLLMMMCGNSFASAELPVPNPAEPVTFHGEIAKGLKIAMKLYRDGSSLRGTYLYEVFGRDIEVKGTVNEHGEIALEEFVKEKVTGSFKGRFVSKDRIEGKWCRSGSDQGRSFFLDATRVLSGVTPILTTSKLNKGEPDASTGVSQVQPVRTSGEIAKAALTALQSPPEEQSAQRIVPAGESLKTPAKADAQSVEKARVEGRAIYPAKKTNLPPWTGLFFNLTVVCAVGGILLLGGGLAWLAIVAGGAAGLRDNSALFRKANARRLSFLPGVVMVALGVGAVLAVFVE